MRTVDPSAPGWYPDPTGRHERRYWSGIRWSRHVDNGGERGDDPIEPDSREQPAVRTPAPAVPAVPEPPQLAVEQFQPSYDRLQPPTPLQRPSRPWIVGVAAALLVMVGIGAVLATQGGGGDGSGDNRDSDVETGQNDDPLMDHMLDFNRRATGDTITDAQARCMARQALGQVTRERMMEAGVLETANPLTVLTKDEVIRLITAAYDCLENEELITAMASTWSPNRFGGISADVAPCLFRGWIEEWGRERAVNVFANLAMPEWAADLETFLTPEEHDLFLIVVGDCVAATQTTTTTAAG
jgi:hypothetical protein